MAPVAVIAGTSVGRHVAQVAYRPWGASKVFGLPGRGLGAMEGTYRNLELELLAWVSQQGEPVVLAGHSQGALHAVRFAIDHSALVSQVIPVAGPFLGSAACWGPRIGCVAGMAPDSLWLKKLRDRSRHLQNVTLVAGSKDLLVEVDSAFGLPVPRARRLLLDCGHVGLMVAPELRDLLAAARS